MKHTSPTSSRRSLAKSTLALAIFSLLFLSLPESAPAQLRAFPGAEGFGSLTPGGRGGAIKFVTNLNNSGPGSLRAACEANGPRIVVFRVGGTINLSSQIEIENPYITIAGQTAPGDGICLKGDMIQIKTHDVVIRNVRIRTGVAKGIHGHGVHIGPGASDFILDHCSFSWSLDALVMTWDTVSNGTVQNCFITEVLSDHSANLGPGPGNSNNGSRYMTSMSFLRNYLAHGVARNPKVHYQAEVANNLVYNWGNYACYASMYAELDFIGNHYIKGPSSGVAKTISLQDPFPSMRIYVSGNRTPELPNGGSNQWTIVNGSNQYQSTTRLHSSGYQAMPSSEVFEYVLMNAGAIPRDPVDARVENDVRNGTGGLIRNESEVGGYPSYSSAPAPLDTDNDGMPDTWETSHGLNPNNPGDANGDRDGDGYTNIEEYVNSFFLTEPTGSTIQCSEIISMISRCLSGGTIKVKVGLTNNTHAGETLQISIDGVPHEAVIGNNSQALITVGGFSSGNHVVSLINPPGCVDPINVNCLAGASMEESLDEGAEFATAEVPAVSSLVGNYPNPFNPTTTIRYQLAVDAEVSLILYDVLGRKVQTLQEGFVRAGYHEVLVNGSDLVSGVYFYRLQAGSFSDMKSLMLLK